MSSIYLQLGMLVNFLQLREIHFPSLWIRTMHQEYILQQVHFNEAAVTPLINVCIKSKNWLKKEILFSCKNRAAKCQVQYRVRFLNVSLSVSDLNLDKVLFQNTYSDNTLKPRHDIQNEFVSTAGKVTGFWVVSKWVTRLPLSTSWTVPRFLSHGRAAHSWLLV